MRKIALSLGLSLVFLIGCNERNLNDEVSDVNFVKNFKFENKSKKQKFEFFQKCVNDPIGVGMIKFNRDSVREYNIANKDLERLLIKQSEFKDAYFYGEFFVIKPKLINENLFSKNENIDFTVAGDSELSICSGIIFAATSNGIVNDNCDFSGRMAFNTGIMHACAGANVSGTADQLYAGFMAWDFDAFGDTQRALNASPVGEVYGL
ncbi:hypothetical protein [Chryseobacterium sp. 5_R23647]|uniref:hypothetical protein n=1 Tax=Chryseobacterium sp. 5_R23647 TaxID=2258964 RepID=UPI000E2501F5|nr:hypothetical protein [Chryseobacterium sp. 5_R23647]REC41642.1 hypothetical protein DRF69_13975 [Chryseobacterium sp. 5_R23647]